MVSSPLKKRTAAQELSKFACVRWTHAGVLAKPGAQNAGGSSISGVRSGPGHLGPPGGHQGLPARVSGSSTGVRGMLLAFFWRLKCVPSSSFQVSGFRFQVSGLKFLKFQVSSFRFPVSGFFSSGRSPPLGCSRFIPAAGWHTTENR